MEQEKKYYKNRYNPACPNCKEEHIYYNVLISEEDQKFMDDYYKAHKEESSLAVMLEEPPLVVESTFKCPICKTQFIVRHGLYRENQVGYQSDDVIPMGVRYELAQDTKKFTYQITDWVRKCSGAACMKGTVYTTEGYGFLCIPRNITERLVKEYYIFDEADAWLDLWCHTVTEDPNNVFFLWRRQSSMASMVPS